MNTLLNTNIEIVGLGLLKFIMNNIANSNNNKIRTIHFKKSGRQAGMITINMSNVTISTVAVLSS